MLFNLFKIPQGVKDGKAREEIPDLIVQYYGTEGSIFEIDKIMKNIPRNDAAVQQPLRPFVEKLKKQRQGKKGTMRKLSIDHGSATKKQKPAADLKSCQPDQMDSVGAVESEKKTEEQDSSQKPVESIKTSKALSAAVQTGRIEIMGIKMSSKKKTHLVVEFNGRMQTVIVTTRLLANTFGLEVEDDFERRLRYQMPLTAEAKLQGNKVIYIKKMDPVGEMRTEEQDSSPKLAAPSKTFKVQSAAVRTGRIKILGIKKSNNTNIHLMVEFNGRKRTFFLTNRLLASAFGLEVDDDFERRLCSQMPLTAEATIQGKKKITDIKKMDSVGAETMEQKTENKDVSLKPVESSKTSKAQSAAVQTGRIQIMEIKTSKKKKKNKKLVVEFNGQMQKFFVTTRLLANAFGLKVDDDIERRLRSQMPLTAEATLEGNKITDIRVNPNLEMSERTSLSGSLAEKQKPDAGKKRKREEEEEEEWIDVTSDHPKIPILEIFDGKVVQKSGLRMYKTPKKEKKFFFYLAVADEKASVKVMVYGKKRFQEIKEESSYLFKKLTIDEYGVKVTKSSKVLQMSPVDVPEKREMEARKLIYPESPMYSIKEAKLSADKTEVSVEGTITDIDPVQKTDGKDDTERGFQLKDNTDSIDIFMWGDAIEQCNGLSVGDVVKVTNIKIHQFFETTLNSTVYSRIEKVQSVGTKKARIKIIGIIKASQEETYLEAEFNNQPHMFVVDSPLLAKTFGFELDEDFEESLLDKIPLSADAEIQGTVSLNSTVYSRIEKMDPVELEEEDLSLEAAESSKTFKMTSRLLEKSWKRALSSILEKLTERQFAKMLFNLVKFPVKLKTGKARRYISYLIFEHFGTYGSISEIDKMMKMIPINDAAVQKLLRPFVEKLKKHRQEEKGMTSNHATGPGSVTKKPKPFFDLVQLDPEEDIDPEEDSDQRVELGTEPCTFTGTDQINTITGVTEYWFT
ncbi:uncharacterized protein LOC120543670 isoform X2 [Perca fluviatilis]|uniref:uncharacterized protein LOC120543670 isoform X2 n=1 Tax=Perca fluviatilis TaxID=8168 RepID=UPI00196476AF|nr:uncharacterized protein LOC120543670 isoform X2 [Perca fluviatilis]